jgi:hypothetical protein
MLAVAPEKCEFEETSDMLIQRHAMRFKAWSIMVAIAVLAIGCSVVTHAESALGNAVAIIVACAACLTYKKYFESLAHRQTRGLTTSEKEKRILLATSATIAVTIMGLSDAAFMTGY